MHVWIGGDKQGDEFVWTTGTLTIGLNMSKKCNVIHNAKRPIIVRGTMEL